MLLSEISFDEQDRNLFQVPDARLRADALKHSILPRLYALLNEVIASIREVYSLEALEDNTISYYPQFRSKRTCELELLYDHAFVGLAGKRIKNKWHGFTRKDGKPVQFLPFRLGISLAEAGLRIDFQNYWLKGLTDDSHQKLFAFHHQHEALITRICFAAEMHPLLYYGNQVRPLSSINEHYEFMKDMGFYDNNFYSNILHYPISPKELSTIVQNFTFFYPIYESYLCLAKGMPEQFLALVEQTNDWIEKQENSTKAQFDLSESSEITAASIALAEQRVKVMPALRWQVFQRDNWKCCSCGRGSAQGVILHVDHIIPRSKGGTDSLDNLQTLCSECNIGKSNRDSTNLSRRSG